MVLYLSTYPAVQCSDKTHSKISSSDFFKILLLIQSSAMETFWNKDMVMVWFENFQPCEKKKEVWWELPWEKKKEVNDKDLWELPNRSCEEFRKSTW